SKKEDKRLGEQLDRAHKKAQKENEAKFVRKLGLLLDEEKSGGIRNMAGDVVIRGGTVLKEEVFANLADIEKLDFHNDWVDDKKKNALVTKIFENYFLKQSDIDEYYKHEKTKILLGDELPSGIVQLAKVYVAKKRKLSVG